MIVVNISDFGPMVWAFDLGWCSLVSGACNVFEFGKGLLDVALHAANEFPFVVIPIKIDTDLLFGSKINFEGILFIHDADEVLHLVIVGVFDAKVVNN